MGFGQGLSGLNAAAQNLDIIGNNIANSGTVGFKAGTATFADVYAGSRVGLGVQVASVNQRFTTGIVSSTGNQFDMAIDGPNGFFRVVDSSDNVLYTRNGQFFANKDNEIVNAQGQRLTGYAAGGTNLVPITVPVGNIDPVATTYINNTVNLDADATVVPAATLFDPDDAATYSNSIPITVYDSLGKEHRATQYFTKRPADTATNESVWDVNFVVQGATITPSSTMELRFDDAGRVSTAPPSTTVTINVPAGASPAQAMTVNMNFAGSTQFGGGYTQNFVLDGNRTGEYASMSIGTNGEIIANYTNGAQTAVGTLALADFNNLQGLQPMGGNAWSETAASGQPILGQPGSNGLATIKGQAVEESNVDMSQELVNMIIAQRTYQANAQTIKTQDQIMQTLISMR
ncbi:MAG: flagellar hook protein FlgE [Alcaligenaceae bacterium]|nr:flagellar hook protein FlgE [Alcaligenaceae bacterium]